jgi:aspartyl-tRNA(Asn)/glutamyl-tRNA(Gln) amidotransferase subunit C
MNKITKDNVVYIASLSRIYLREDEVESLTRNLEGILEYIDKLEKLDVTHVKPTSHIFSLENVYRSDDVKPSLTQEQALSIAVEQHNGSFKVPKVIE